MRLAIAALVLFAMGCKTGHSGVGGHAHCGPGCHADGHGHALCHLCEKKKQPAPYTAPAPSTAPEEETRQAVVTQDIMLIPRMVYVPYAPQVPVAPARMASMMPGVRPMVPQRYEAPPPEQQVAPPPVPQQQICETLDKCAQMMQIMDKRLCDLESRLQAPAPTIIQPVIVEPPRGPRCFPSLFGKPHLPCLGSLCDKP
jgi:hypothetical protein